MKESHRGSMLALALLAPLLITAVARAEEPKPAKPEKKLEVVAPVALTPVEKALSNVEWYLFKSLKNLNESSHYQAGVYYPMSTLAAQKAELMEKIEQLEKYQTLLASQDLVGARGELKQRSVATRLSLLKTALRQVQIDYNKLKRDKDPNYGEENIARSLKDTREILQRDFVTELPKITEGLKPEEAVQVLEAVAMGLKTSHRNIIALGERNLLGPDFTHMDMEQILAVRALDVLAKWGTKEAWAAIGRVAEKSQVMMVETAAVQHLLRMDTLEKRQGLASLPPTKFLAGIRKVEADAPLKFSRGRTYYDTSKPELDRVVFQGMEASPEFGRAHAHERFVLATNVDTSIKGLEAATVNLRAPTDRWSRLPLRVQQRCGLAEIAK